MDLPAILVACGLRSYGTVPQVWGGDTPGCEHEWGEARIKKSTGGHPDFADGGELRGTRWEALTGAFCLRCKIAWRGEHGLEPDLGLWLAHEVLIWREVRRVLRDDGTAFINCGDAYASTPNGRKAADQKAAGTDDRTMRDKPVSTVSRVGKSGNKGNKGGDFYGPTRGAVGFKPKDRLLMPHRLAIALHSDGWFVRDEIILAKKNPMPSSVKDRTCPAHEMLFMLTKREKYFYDFAAIQEPCSATSHEGRRDGTRAPTQSTDDSVASWTGRELPSSRLRRSVWSSATEPFPGSHFATAATAWVRPCIQAGSSAKGVCPKCGAPWVRETTERGLIGDHNQSMKTRGSGEILSRTQAGGGYLSANTTDRGWSASCKCPDNIPVPATVLDPFGGSGTTGLVADSLGRDCILIELSPTYAAMARDRLKAGLIEVDSDTPQADAGPLFT